MEDFFIRLFIVNGIIWLVQQIVDTLGITQPLSKVIMVITIVLGVIWLLADHFRYI